eukprot:gnl/Trimastix_PCT/4540.p1 GENE.gnl/Trimastix_PCT/4540~~gnl/Trimastix_PCT/4540.p1  ORF type:complete len:305 (+),score=19.61 gnl/Trimastix_PCT/4540:31-945(+)
MEDTHPPFSRIFISCDRRVSLDDIKAHFEQFGTVEDFYPVMEKMDPSVFRGMIFVKYDRASSAAKAIEHMHGKTIVGSRVKVDYAYPKNSIIPPPPTASEDIPQNSRLFIQYPREQTEGELTSLIMQHGDPDYIQLVRTPTGQPRGMANVKFPLASIAFRVLEGLQARIASDKLRMRVSIARPRSTNNARAHTQSAPHAAPNAHNPRKPNVPGVASRMPMGRGVPPFLGAGAGAGRGTPPFPMFPFGAMPPFPMGRGFPPPFPMFGAPFGLPQPLQGQAFSGVPSRPGARGMPNDRSSTCLPCA